MISVESDGSFNNLERFLRSIMKRDIYQALDIYARDGVRALASATPRDSGLTAQSWDYRILESRDSYSIVWTNSHVNEGVPIAIILQYGHGTGTGGYVAGQDYINPAIRPTFDRIANNVWKAVTAA